VYIETDKVVMEVVAPDDGTLAEIIADTGATVQSQQLIGRFVVGAVVAPEAGVTTAAPAADPGADAPLSPAARQLAAEHGVDPTSVKGSGKGGRVTKEDVVSHVARAAVATPAATAAVDAPRAATMPSTPAAALAARPTGDRPERRVPMTRLRARVAERLLDASRNTAMLTTFNEVNMKPIMDLRAKYKKNFEEKFGIGLGFMSFFTRAVCIALKDWPAVNASINGDEIIYHDFCDISIAVSAPKGLVVPVIRNAETLSLAEIESEVKRLATKARDNKLSIDEMTGGTFTITNGGVFGSMMSTPIINPPQSGILGMHNIVERPVAENGQIVIRPMMYVALSYDHRIIDGRESVSFLVRVKTLLENPEMMLNGKRPEESVLGL
jgi:2-oxoglutarate dehydrogenase E2 component (dihydrolipoamide succinyltransferase)